MNASSARYLIRFDDLCPTMSRSRLESYMSVLGRYGIRPIVSVVPDNQDPALKIEEADPDFWDRMRSLEAAGATIAMHGYHHLCASRGKSLLGLHGNTEFAGVEETQQRTWIRSGLGILRDHGLSPRLFVAPRHGFDRATLRALAREGLGVLSDGFAHRPYTRDEIIWIPQQLWEPVIKSSGLWTICIHTNTAPESLDQKLEHFLEGNAARVTCFDEVIADCEPSDLRMSERLGEAIATLRIRMRGSRDRLPAT
jgi:predicted deacetylase